MDNSLNNILELEGWEKKVVTPRAKEVAWRGGGVRNGGARGGGGGGYGTGVGRGWVTKAYKHLRGIS